MVMQMRERANGRGGRDGRGQGRDKPAVGATADAMSALLALTVRMKRRANSPALTIVTVAVVMAVVLDKAPMAALMNDSSGRWYLLYC